jgi:uncharacterized protein
MRRDGCDSPAEVRNMRKIWLTSVCVLGICASAGAQERPSIPAQPNTIFVGGDGKFEASPDTALINFAISDQEKTAAAAYGRASKTAEQIREILRSNGISPQSAEIGYFAVQPVYDYKVPKHEPIAYRVSSNVSVKLKDFAKIGTIFEQFSSADVTDNQQLSYILENRDAAKTKAIEDAYRRAKESATAIAQASGRTIGALVYASVDTSESPFPIRPLAIATPRVATAEAPPPTAEFSAQQVTVTAHVNALFQLK